MRGKPPGGRSIELSAHALVPREHDHVFGQDRALRGERRAFVVLGLTAITMVAEIAAGIAFRSMALLADGLHMASHAAALAIAGFAYIYARRRARDEAFSFGTGKVNALAGYTGAVILGLFAVVMAWESVERLLHPVSIAFDQAIFVAVIGLAVNAVSVVILGGHHPGEGAGESGGDDSGDRRGEHADGRPVEGPGDPSRAGLPEGADARHREDHNLRSAYFHVLADALTSVLAIGALLSGKYLGFAWLDPAMGIIGAVLVSHWSLGLLRTSSRVLLDRQAPDDVLRAVREAIERAGGARVVDLHVWSIGPGIRAAAISVVTGTPRSPDAYKALLPPDLAIVHATVEVHESGDGGAATDVRASDSRAPEAG